MPGLKRTSTYITPGGAKRRKTKSASVVSVPRGIRAGATPIRRIQKATMKYSQIKTIDIASGVVQNSTGFYVFRAASLYDPDYALGGHQPRGFDQLAAIYGEYRVNRATIECRFVSQSGFEFHPFIQISSDASEIPSATSVMESPDRVISKHPISTGNAGPISAYLALSVDPIRYQGSTHDSDVGRVTVESNVSNVDEVYFKVGLAKAVPDGSSMKGDLWITITYDCEFSKPKNPDES